MKISEALTSESCSRLITHCFQKSIPDKLPVRRCDGRGVKMATVARSNCREMIDHPIQNWVINISEISNVTQGIDGALYAITDGRRL